MTAAEILQQYQGLATQVGDVYLKRVALNNELARLDETLTALKAKYTELEAAHAKALATPVEAPTDAVVTPAT